MPLPARRCAVPFLCPLILFSASATALSRPGESAPAAGPVRLAVFVVFDQMRGDYPTRWEELYGEGGFRRLLRDGASYRNCHYPYAVTLTGAGHASLATGASPRTHGVIGNEWYDRAAGTVVSCATDPRYRDVPPLPHGDGAAERGASGGSGWPGRILAPTLADALKQATEGKARVVSLSFKERSAVLPGGQHPEACYWFETATGRFVTSSYYRDRAHPWVEAFNNARPADAWFGRPWERLRPDLDYARYSGPDDAPGESTGMPGKGGANQGVVFPHPMSLGLEKPGRQYYDALFTSPFGNDLLLDLTLAAIDAEELGRHTAPDLLCVSFSCNDYVGHAWGPDSQEVLDATLRSDLVLRKLLDHLDRRVGRGRYALALSADHGICPLPEASRLRGLDARRVQESELVPPAEKFLHEKFHVPSETRCLQRFKGGSALLDDALFLDRSWLRASGLAQGEVEAALAGWLRQQPAIAGAWTATELASPTPRADELGKRAWRSYFPGRSGDVLFALKPYYLLAGRFARGTTHGSPHPYDTHVPLLVYGPRVRPGARAEAVTPLSAAAILANALGVATPTKCEAPVPDGLFER
jgi:hypothetical protein